MFQQPNRNFDNGPPSLSQLSYSGAVPLLTVSGDLQAQGFGYGTALRERIHSTFELYSTLFGLAPAALLKRGQQVLDRIAEFHEPYAELISAVATGSGLLPEEVACLNARTELLHEAGLAHRECTSVYLPQTSILGQNWDWTKRLDSLMFLLKVQNPDGRSFVTLTEPGIIGKIGVNSDGIGVCLNILPANFACDGVPVHVLLRSVLDSSSLEEAKERVAAARLGTASSLLVGNDRGECFCAEICGSDVHFTSTHDSPLIRTNHFQDFQVPTPDFFEDSLPRLNRARLLLNQQEQLSLSQIEELFADNTQEDARICAPFEHHPGMLSEVGTLATVLMDLPARRLRIKRAGQQTAFEEVVLSREEV